MLVVSLAKAICSMWAMSVGFFPRPPFSFESDLPFLRQKVLPPTLLEFFSRLANADCLVYLLFAIMILLFIFYSRLAALLGSIARFFRCKCDCVVSGKKMKNTRRVVPVDSFRK